MYRTVIFLVFLMLKQSYCEKGIEISPPHIIFIYADDLGWNDVSFHGSPEIPTPNIDALALSGISLHNYYTEWMCTPSRGALMTGKYPIRLGFQHQVISSGESSALPLDLTILPQHLRKLGYETHMIGKWHLGGCTKAHMPTNRGFTSFIGYLYGVVDYFDYTANNDGFPKDHPTDQVFFGIDLYNGTQPIKNFRGKYATQFFAESARDRILAHDTNKPLFLYLSQIAVHASGSSQRLQAPPEAVKKFQYIKDTNRRIFAGMVSVLDDAVGMVFEALHQKAMLEKSIILFLSDNGGEVSKRVGGYASNFPLRGKKSTLWEGGIRVPGIIWSPLFNLRNPKISHHLIHVTDWLPTLYRAAGGNPSDLGKTDGHDLWKVFTEDWISPRTDILHNIDPIYGISSYRKGDLKVVNGTTPEGFDSWYGQTGFEHVFPISMESWVFKDGSTVRDILMNAGMGIAQTPDDWYRQHQVICQQPPPRSSARCDPNIKPCLFNIRNDPCEYTDLASLYPEDVKSMMAVIHDYQKVAVPPQKKPLDPRADPACHDFTFVPWLEPEHYTKCDHLSEQFNEIPFKGSMFIK